MNILVGAKELLILAHVVQQDAERWSLRHLTGLDSFSYVVLCQFVGQT